MYKFEWTADKPGTYRLEASVYSEDNRAEIYLGNNTAGIESLIVAP